MARSKTAAAAESLGFLVIAAGILVLLNVLGAFGVYGRADLTQKRLFSLSSGSKRLVSTLDDQMEIVAYLTRDLPPDFLATQDAVRDLLAEYQAASKGKVTVRIVNPDTDEEKEAAERDGVQLGQFQDLSTSSITVKQGFSGLVIKYLGDKRTIPFLEGTSGLEYRISTLIKELRGEKTKIGVVSGKGGPSLGQGLSGLREALPTYDIQEVDLSAEVPRDLRALLIVAPENAFTDDELRRVDAYVMRGGSLAVFGGTTKLDQSGGPGMLTATPVTTNLNRLLEPWGVKIESNVVADAQCGRAPLQTTLGFAIPVMFPPVPIVTVDPSLAEHPVLFRLDQVAMPFTASITRTQRLSGDRQVRTTTLAKSTEQSWLITGDSMNVRPRRPDEWTPTGRSGPFPLVVALEGKLPSAFGGGDAMSSGDGQPAAGPLGPARAERDVRVLVAGTASFLRDEFLPRPGRDGQRDLTSALAFALNAVDWLAQDSDLIAVRAKNVEEPTLRVPQDVTEALTAARSAAQEGNREEYEKAIEKRKQAAAAWERKQELAKWSLIAVLPLLVGAGGAVRWQIRKRARAGVKL